MKSAPPKKAHYDILKCQCQPTRAVTAPLYTWGTELMHGYKRTERSERFKFTLLGLLWATSNWNKRILKASSSLLKSYSPLASSVLILTFLVSSCSDSTFTNGCIPSLQCSSNMSILADSRSVFPNRSKIINSVFFLPFRTPSWISVNYADEGNPWVSWCWIHQNVTSNYKVTICEALVDVVYNSC